VRSGATPLPNAAARLVDETLHLTSQFADRANEADVAQQLVLARGLIEQLEGLWLVAAADFESSGGVTDAGSGSLGAWMRTHCRMAPGEASARSRVAHAVTNGELGRTGEALVEGAVTWRQAQTIHSAVQHIPDDRKAEAEDAMVSAAASLDPAQLRQVGDRLLHCFDRERSEQAAVRRYERRGLSVAETFDGLFSVSGLLDPITGALFLTALNTKLQPPAASEHGNGPSSGDGAAVAQPDLRTWSQRRADALGEICSEWLASDNTATVGGVRPHLSVIVDIATLRAGRDTAAPDAPPPGQLAWAGPITTNESLLIGCDAAVSRILMDGPSQVLDVGRTTRSIPPAIRRAVIARDRTCAAPGCHRPPEHCDVHHIKHWADGGETSLDNTVLTCRRHHRLIHQMGWQVTIDRSGHRSIGPP
jgi:hypothetical protein